MVEHCGASDEYAEIVYFGREVVVIIIEDMILKMSVNEKTHWWTPDPECPI